jgi:hypothetical protein
MGDYIFEHEGKQFSPNGVVSVDDVNAHNKAVEANQLQIWVTAPEYQMAYVKAREVTTWLGTVLGTIIYTAPVHNNFGGRMASIRVKGTNGKEYWGRYSTDQQLIRLRLCRDKRKRR